jgi:hypothetical protein
LHNANTYSEQKTLKGSLSGDGGRIGGTKKAYEENKKMKKGDG